MWFQLRRFFAVYSWTDHCCNSVFLSYLIVPFGQHLVITNVEPGFYCGLRYQHSADWLTDGWLLIQQQIFTLGGGLRAAQSISYRDTFGAFGAGGGHDVQ